MSRVFILDVILYFAGDIHFVFVYSDFNLDLDLGLGFDFAQNQL